MQSSNLLVSVIIPTYNRGFLIKDTIESVIKQSYKNYELIIIDDASTDKTADWISKNYPEFKLIRMQKNVGNAAARNIGINASKGEFIAFLDHDDQWLPNYLESQVKQLQFFPEAVLSYCNYFEVSQNNNKILKNLKPLSAYDDFTYHLLMQNVIHSLSLTLLRKSSLLEAGSLNESLHICNDIDLYLKLSVRGKILHLPEALVLKNNHDNNLSRNYWLWSKEIIKVYDQFFEKNYAVPYLQFKNQVKCHEMVKLFKLVWPIYKDYKFALWTQFKALTFDPHYRFTLLSQRWKKQLSKLSF